jgi:hypothetical protein
MRSAADVAMTAAEETRPSLRRFPGGWEPAFELAFILGPMLLSWLAFGSLQAHPHNDDFLYGRTVEILSREGRLVWVSNNGQLPAAALTPVLLAGAVCRQVGFDYRWLHLVSLIQVALAPAALYLLARRVGIPRGRRIAIAAGVAWSPMVFGQSFTFMTDGPALGWMVASLAGFAVGLRERRTTWIMLGAIAGALGVWTRQTSLAVIVTPAVWWLLETRRTPGRTTAPGSLPEPAAQGAGGEAAEGVTLRDRRRLKDVGLTALAILGPVLALIALEFGSFGPPTADRARLVAERRWDAAEVRRLALAGYGAALVVSFLALPLAPLALLHREVPGIASTDQATFGSPARSRGRRLWRWAIIIVAALPLLAFLAGRGRAPLTSATGYFLENAHLGPMILSRIHPRFETDGLAWPAAIPVAVTLASLVGLVTLAPLAAADLVPMNSPGQGLWSGAADGRDRSLRLALLSGAVLSALGLLALMSFSFDRYWLTPFAFVAVWFPLAIAPNGPVARDRSSCSNGPPRFSAMGESSADRDDSQVLEGVMPPARREGRLEAPPDAAPLGLITSFAITSALLVGSLVLTHDWLAYNAARWRLAERAIRRLGDPSRVDGGYEINGWHRSAVDPGTGAEPGSPAWWSKDATEFLVVSVPPGHVEVDQEPWFAGAVGRTMRVRLVRAIQ